MTEQRAWLVLAVGSDRQHGGNDGYDDEPRDHYDWDSTVPHHADLAAGDVIAIWNKKALVGVSVIEKIKLTQATKTLNRCPHCGMAGIKARKTKAPIYKCFKCNLEFDIPNHVIETVTQYRSTHAKGWRDIEESPSGSALRNLCVHPKSQQSLRLMVWDDFYNAVDMSGMGHPLAIVVATAALIKGGHTKRMVDVRIGQSEFRQRLFERFGPVCAFTGPAPKGVLEAAHLYSYATMAEHRQDGGLLLRRDIHRLFDEGLLAVEPETLLIDIHDDLMPFAFYATLAGQGLHVDLTKGHRRWLRDHWTLYRT